MAHLSDTFLSRAHLTRCRFVQTLTDLQVFICELNDREYALLRGELKEYVHHKEDQVLILDLGLADNTLEIGQGLDCIGHGYSPPQRVIVV